MNKEVSMQVRGETSSFSIFDVNREYGQRAGYYWSVEQRTFCCMSTVTEILKRNRARRFEVNSEETESYVLE